MICAYLVVAAQEVGFAYLPNSTNIQKVCNLFAPALFASVSFNLIC